MRTRAIVIAAVVGLLLLVGAGGVYAYDRAQADKIGDGVRVGGVDVSGLTPEQARAKLRAAVVEPLSRPVTIRGKGERFRLTAERAQVAVDIDGSVEAALERTRSGNMLARTWRGLRGEEVDAELELDIDYSKKAIRRLVKRVGEKLEKPAVDASVDLESGDVAPQPAELGRRVLKQRLKRDLKRRLLDVGPVKMVRARTGVVRPKVTTEELVEKYPAILVVDRSAFQLTLYKKLKPVKTYRIAVGAAGRETPAGLYNIQNKAVNPAWNVPNSDWAGDLAGKVIAPDDPQNPLKARWMGIYDGAGIHGTADAASIGTAASKGCIRMRIPEVIELYDQVPVNAPVYIS